MKKFKAILGRVIGALIMQLFLLLFFGWVNFDMTLTFGTALSVGFFLGREHSQAESRWKDEWGKKNVFRGFDIRRWGLKDMLDVSVPIVVCFVVWIFSR